VLDLTRQSPVGGVFMSSFSQKYNKTKFGLQTKKANQNE
jgi:hypothetical protein